MIRNFNFLQGLYENTEEIKNYSAHHSMSPNKKKRKFILKPIFDLLNEKFFHHHAMVIIKETEED